MDSSEHGGAQELRTTCLAAGTQRAGNAASLLLFAIFLLQLLTSSLAVASELPRFLTDIEAPVVFPGADRIAGPEGDPPVAAAFSAGEQTGFVFLTSDYVNTT